jgi:hypothetical protein
VNLLEAKTISHVSVIPFALMFGVISAIIGVVIGIIYAIMFGAILSTAPTTSTFFDIDISWLRVLFGVGAVVIMPILTFAAGFIQGAIYAILYNFLAPRIGGIQLRFKEDKQIPTET